MHEKIKKCEMEPLTTENKVKSPLTEEYCSSDISQIILALMQFDELTSEIQFDKTGFKKNKYVSLGKLISTIKKPLIAVGIRCIQIKSSCEGKIYLNTVLYHQPSQQWIKSIMYFADEKERTPQEMQDFGACTTYAKRYELNQVLNLVGTDDDLDDMPIQESKPVYQNYKTQIKPASYDHVKTTANIKYEKSRTMIQEAIAKNESLKNDLCDLFNVNNVNEIPNNKLETVLLSIDEFLKL